MRILIYLSCLCITSLVMGQTSISILGEPTLNLTSIGSTPKSQSDSLKNKRTHDYSLGLGLEIRMQIDRYQSISIVPGYTQSNMQLVKEGLNFLDVVHPELPEIRDLAYAANKIAYLSYRQKYVGTQVLYAKELQLRSPNTKIRFEIGGGLGGYILVQNDVKIRTEGFAIKGNYEHIIKNNTGIDARKFLINMSLHGDMKYQVTPSFTTFAGIKAGIPLVSTTTSTPKITIYTPSLRLGVRYKL